MEMYDPEFPDELKKMLGRASMLRAVKVRHQQTCPDCGRTLVNTYREGNVWKCRRCWAALERSK